jgi:hypothetical protein
VPAAGFLGSVLVVLPHLFLRTIRSDLQSRTFLHMTIRLVVAPFLAVPVGYLTGLAADRGIVLIVAFGTGLFPDRAFMWFSQQWNRLLSAQDDARQSLPLRCLHGIQPDDELRLWQEGITDAQHLATENVVTLLINTAYPLGRIIDWKDQAFLFVYVGSEMDKWRHLSVRGAMDVLGLAPRYYSQARYEQIRAALATELHTPEPVIERLINTVFNDPRVHQLWEFLRRTYPAKLAEGIGAFEDGSAAPSGSAGAPPQHALRVPKST